MRTLTDILDKLPPARRKKVEERSEELIAEELSLRDLRKARRQTQTGSEDTACRTKGKDG